jgi:hypothetical protein
MSQAFRCRQATPSPELKLKLTTKGPRTFMSRQLDNINDIVTSVRLAMTSGYSREIEVQESKTVGVDVNASPPRPAKNDLTSPPAHLNPAPLSTFGFVEWFEGIIASSRKF